MTDIFREVDETPVFVSLEYAAEKTGLEIEAIVAMTVYKEPIGLDGKGPLEYVIRSKQTPQGLMVHLVGAMQVAPGIKAIIEGMDKDRAGD